MDSSQRSDLQTMHASRYEQLVQTVADYAIYMLDLEGHVVSWNLGAQRIKGYNADEVIGRHFSMFFTPQDCAEGRPGWLLNRALSTGGAQDEGWRMRKDGTQYWSHSVLIALRDDIGELRGFVDAALFTIGAKAVIHALCREPDPAQLARRSGATARGDYVYRRGRHEQSHDCRRIPRQRRASPAPP